MSKTPPAAKLPPDQDARDLIERQLDINLLVEAGAGSGKTQSLAGRMAAGIVEGRYEVQHMAAVTFTRKAAAELRGRFQLALEGYLKDGQDPARRGRIQQALAGLERLFAGTIHSFCAHLLRERPVEAGVAPGFEEADDATDVEMRRHAWRDYVERERAQSSPALLALAEADVRPKDLDHAFDRVCQYQEVDFPAEEVAAPDPAPVWQALDEFVAALMRLLPGDIDPRTTCGVQQRLLDLQGRRRVAERSRPAALAEIVAGWKSEPKIVQKWWSADPKAKKAASQRVAGLVTDFREQVALPFLSAWRQHVYALALKILLGARTYAADTRRHSLTLNYGDLLHEAARLLRENLEVRAALQRKYRWLFVDEFQDTDPIQAEVILLLSAEPGAGADWTQVPLRAGALFIVGDPKQSIYRFRRADIDTYLQVRRRIQETGGQVTELTASFRSVPALCEWANGAFRDIFPAEATPQQPAFGGLDPTRAAGKTGQTGVRVLTIPATVDKAGQVPEAEATAIARFIRSEIDAGRNPGDFLLLTRKKKQIPLYAQALESLHVPVAVSGGAAFAASQNVAALAGLLRVLADPGDGVAAVGVLRGPLFGLSDRVLFQHRQAGHGFLLTAPDVETTPGPVGEALKVLRQMYGWTRSLPASAAVERILEATGLLALGAATTPGGAEAGNLLHAVDRVRQVTELGDTLADAADSLDEDLESEDLDSIALEPGRSNVVRLMNLHKAKGLEAPVVFLADPTGGVTERVNIRIVRDGPRALGYFQLTRPFGEYGHTVLGEPADWAAHEAAELEYVRAEERRLLYVAATRAKDLLVVGRWAKSGGRNTRSWELLDKYLAGTSELKIPSVTLPAPGALPDLSPAARAAAQTAREERQRAAAMPSWQVESVTATARHAAPAGHPVQADRTREPDTGMAWGTLIHFLLENAMRGPTRERAHLERLANWFTVDKPELRAVIGEALDTVEGVFASDFWRSAQAAPERHVEVPFAVKVQAADGSPKILHGVIDLAFSTPAGWDLVDYKTDQITPGIAELVARYRFQVRTYGEHWSRLAAAPARRGLHFVRAGETRWEEGT